jgi:hypothetical protein
MRKFPILFTLLTTMIASTLSSILAMNSLIPTEGYSYNGENPPISLSVDPSATNFVEGDTMDYQFWDFILYYADSTSESLSYDSGWFIFSIEQGTNLLHTDTEITIIFQDSDNSLSIMADPIDITVNRTLTDFTFISGTTEFIHDTPINYDDWVFQITYFYGDIDTIYADDASISFSLTSGLAVYDSDTIITVNYDNFSEGIFANVDVSIVVESIVIDIFITSPGVNPIDGDIVDYSSWGIELVYSDNETELISYDQLEVYPSPGSFWDPSDFEVSFRYVDVRTNVDLTVYYSIFVEMRELFFSIGTITAPIKDTYFVGDALDFTGFAVEVIENSYFTSLIYDADNVEVFIYSMDPYTILSQNYVLTEFDLLTEIHFEISTGDFYYSSYDNNTGFPVTVYPYPAYQMNFKTLGDQTTNVSSSSRQSMLLGDTWLVKADEPTLLYSQSMVPQGLVIGDDNQENLATEVSFLSSSIWGVGGEADGLPIIQSIYLKAYSTNTQVQFFINGQLVGINNLNSDAGESWIIFNVDQTNLRVGHLEMRLLQPNGDSPITLEELRIVSNNDYEYNDVMNMLTFANTIESLDTCIDQSSFLSANQSDYDFYVDSFNTLFTDLRLLDLSTPESNRDELRVNLGDKWAMMESLHGEVETFSFFRGLNQTTDTTQTFWLGWFFIGLLFTFYWKKRMLNHIK